MASSGGGGGLVGQGQAVGLAVFRGRGGGVGR